MAKKIHAYFVYLYLGFVVLDILASSLGRNDFRVVTKPLILISLLVYFVISGKQLEKTNYLLMVAALFFSLLGDVFLLFEAYGSLFFTLGLASFLMAHILYTLLFLKKRNLTVPKNFGPIVIGLLCYGALLFYQLKDSLGALKIPVVFYIFGILTMVISAYYRKGNVPNDSFGLVFIGALFFVISDSILAIDKFMVAIPLSHIAIMATYATAQYLITKGVLRQSDFGN